MNGVKKVIIIIRTKVKKIPEIILLKKITSKSGQKTVYLLANNKRIYSQCQNQETISK